MIRAALLGKNGQASAVGRQETRLGARVLAALLAVSVTLTGCAAVGPTYSGPLPLSGYGVVTAVEVEQPKDASAFVSSAIAVGAVAGGVLGLVLLLGNDDNDHDTKGHSGKRGHQESRRGHDGPRRDHGHEDRRDKRCCDSDVSAGFGMIAGGVAGAAAGAAVGAIGSALIGDGPGSVRIHVRRIPDGTPGSAGEGELVVTHPMNDSQFATGDRVRILSDGTHTRLLHDNGSAAVASQLPSSDLALAPASAPALSGAVRAAAGASPTVISPLASSEPPPRLAAADRAAAKALFARYDALVRAFDPAAADLYADNALIRNISFDPNGQAQTKEMPARTFKSVFRSVLPSAKAHGDHFTHSSDTYVGEGPNVRITTTRHSSLKARSAAISMLVGPTADGQWAILEEISQESKEVGRKPQSPSPRARSTS